MMQWSFLYGLCTNLMQLPKHTPLLSIDFALESRIYM